MAMDCSTRLGTLDEHLLCSWPTVRFFMESTMFGDHRETSSESARISMLRGCLLLLHAHRVIYQRIHSRVHEKEWKRSLTSTAINKRISMISLRWKRCGGEQARETLLPEWSDQWTCRCPRFRGRSIIAYLSAYPCPLCVFAYTLTFNHCTINRTSDLAFRIWFLHPWLCNLCGAEKQ